MHCFNPVIAEKYGIAEAVIIHNFQFWISHNMRNERHQYEGRTWTYNTTKALAQAFPYLTEKQIWLAIDRLVKAGVLMKGNFNQTAYDRTTWYAFTLEGFWIRPEGEFHFPRVENPTTQKGEPIPDTLPDTHTDETPPADAGGASDRPATSKKKTAKKNRPAGQAPDLNWQKWVDRYEEHVKEQNEGIGHNWNGAQLGMQGLKGIRKHLVNVAIKKQGVDPDEAGLAAWDYILKNWSKLNDEFLQREFDLTVILKKITNILNRLKNGSEAHRGTSAGSGTSGSRVTAVSNY